MTACSVVVPTLGRPQVLAGCLEALGRLDHDDFEVVVVDNTSGDPEVRRLCEQAGARLVVEPRRGASRARNAGARAARGEVVAFTDDDARPRPDWLRRHDDALRADSSLSATTGRVLPWPFEDPMAQAYLATRVEELGEVPFRIDRTTRSWFERTNFGGVGVGPNMVFRRWLFEAGWGLRPALGPGGGLPGEEHYAFYTLVRDGHVIAYLPDAVVDHLAPTAEVLTARRRYLPRGTAAYALMLLLEEREHRRDVVRFLAGAIGGRRRAWRAWTPAPLNGPAQRVGAAVRAPLDVAVWRLRVRGADTAAPPRVPGPLGLAP